MEGGSTREPWSYSFPATSFGWPPRSYTCSFCKREFRSAQALGGHMNVHRRDRARLRHCSPPPPPPANHNPPRSSAAAHRRSIPNLNYPPPPSLYYPKPKRFDHASSLDQVSLELGASRGGVVLQCCTEEGGDHGGQLDLELRLGSSMCSTSDG